MAIYKEDIADIELQTGTIHRTFLNNSIGLGDDMVNRFGVRLFRNGEPVNIGDGSCMGIFMAPNGTNIVLTDQYVSGNVAYVQLPQACYNVEGKFTLAIKVLEDDITGTMRIIDGVVNNTGIEGAVAPTDTVPTYQEIIALYDEMLAAKEGAIRYDIEQELTNAERDQARNNIGMVSVSFEQIQGDEYIMVISTRSQFVNITGDDYALIMMAD